MNIEENIVKIVQFARETHQGNVKAGWWSDINTGESILHSRNRGEMLSLVVTELSEGSIGYVNLEMDDKLPEYPMLEVEIADAVIRAGDIIGGELAVHGFDVADIQAKNVFDEIENSTFNRISVESASVDEILMKLINIVSLSVEHFRKGRHLKAVEALVALICCCELISYKNHAFSHSLWHVVQAKKNFNAQRADHKLENRIKDGGKKF